MDLQDIVSSSVAFALGAILMFFAERKLTQAERIVAWLAFAGHAAAALAMVWITVEVLGGGDIRAYHMAGAPLADAMSADFFNVAPDVIRVIFHAKIGLPVPIHGEGSATGAMFGLSAFVFLVFGNSLYGACVVVSMACLFARLVIYRAMCDNITTQERIPVAIACLLVPSVTFWCSGLLKEAFAFCGVAVMFWGVNGIMKRRTPLRSVVAVLAGATLAAVVKPYILMPATVGIGAWLYASLTRQGSALRSIWVLPVVGAFCVVAISGLGVLFPRFAFENLAEESLSIQTMYQYRTSATSTITLFDPLEVAQQDRGFLGQLVYAPLAVLTAMFRPALFDVRNAQMLVNALEATAFTILFIVAIVRNGIKNLLRSMFDRPVLGFCILFVLGMSLGVGLVVSNLGSISRYRTPMMPFFAVALAILCRRVALALDQERPRLSPVQAEASCASAPATSSTVEKRVVESEESWIRREYESNRVSVIVPTHNRAPLVLNAIESVRRQPYRPVEVIVVDDGSTDDTERRVLEWRESSAGGGFDIQYVRKENGGAPTARNEGLRRSTGEFVQFLDSDDALGRHKLSAQVRVLRELPNVDYVWSRSVRSREYLSLDGPPPAVSPRVIVGRERVKAPMRVSDGLYRRNICVDVGPWNVRLPRYQDWEYNIRALSVCRAVAFLDIPAYVVLLHEFMRISKTSPKVYADQIFFACEELTRAAYPYIDNYIKRYMCSQALRSASLLYLKSGEKESALRLAHLAQREAPASTQKFKALGYELALLLAPGATSRLLNRRS